MEKYFNGVCDFVKDMFATHPVVTVIGGITLVALLPYLMDFAISFGIGFAVVFAGLYFYDKYLKN